MSSDVVLYDVTEGIATLTINRPDKGNTMNRAVRAALRDRLAEFAADVSARVLVLTATGDRTFCAGADLVEMAEEGHRIPPPDLLELFGPGNWIDKPTIAAVNGAALAGGFLLVQLCDLCVAADTATFAITEARWGRGAPWALPLLTMIPKRVALELLLTGAPISARRAAEVGLLNLVVPADQLAVAARTMAAQIRDNAPLTVRGHKAMARLLDDRGLTDASAAAHEMFRAVYLSEDALEGPRAFREKRPPVWQNR